MWISLKCLANASQGLALGHNIGSLCIGYSSNMVRFRQKLDSNMYLIVRDTFDFTTGKLFLQIIHMLLLTGNFFLCVKSATLLWCYFPSIHTGTMHKSGSQTYTPIHRLPVLSLICARLRVQPERVKREDQLSSCCQQVQLNLCFPCQDSWQIGVLPDLDLVSGNTRKDGEKE